jgi:hypothetical protein
MNINIKIFTVLLLVIVSSQLFGQHKPFTDNTTLTWDQCIASYDALDKISDQARLLEVGKTDVGRPLDLFVINSDGVFEPELFNRKKIVILVNNGIHPGEPDGIDASLMWCREILKPDNDMSKFLENVIICIIPIYNVDGSLIRGSFSRANQDGPEEYGFRGNARNLDLNRDFIKCDSENARAFSRIFTRLKPDVFIDNHVSDGADYTYTMTLISTQSDKLGGTTGKYLKEKMEPALFAGMDNCGDPMMHYVNTMGNTPQSGLLEFLETPRFASGYAALYNTLSFITETHMLKPFPQRVESTYHFINVLVEYCHKNADEIIGIRKKAQQDWMKMKEWPLNYELDTTKFEKIKFAGYETISEPSKVGSGDRIRYDRSKVKEMEIPYYRKFVATTFVVVPDYYLVPQAWREVIERLRLNGVQMEKMDKDTVIEVETYFLDKFETSSRPYEGHYNHSDTKVTSRKTKVQFFKGDWKISTRQIARRYLIETLEPQSNDSFFTWNFFDSVLQQKEWFSDYVFEEKAEELLKNDSELNKEFESVLAADKNLQNNHWNQLYWLYRHSPYYEKTINRYPVYRLMASPTKVGK